MLEDLDFNDIVISLKASDPKMNYDAYMKMSKETDYPLHVGVTEAGTVERGQIKSAVGIGGLLLAGVGDTMRVSLTGNPIYSSTVKLMINMNTKCKRLLCQR